MTTASITATNIANNTPVILVERNSVGRVYTRATARNAANANFRHLINRRLRWSASEQFVRQTLQMLASEVNNRALGNTSIRPQMERVVEIVRDAANRRRSFVTVELALVDAVEALVTAAERCC